jgi:hypothetical protein
VNANAPDCLPGAALLGGNASTGGCVPEAIAVRLRPRSVVSHLPGLLLLDNMPIWCAWVSRFPRCGSPKRCNFLPLRNAGGSGHGFPVSSLRPLPPSPLPLLAAICPSTTPGPANLRADRAHSTHRPSKGRSSHASLRVYPNSGPARAPQAGMRAMREADDLGSRRSNRASSFPMGDRS